ncbi:MAG TPA: flagellar biosynthesis protein FlhB [Tepidiformaceae bacterium]|nr:flagellar biosynthesis protein FlhB [Tepidiformaceae bacterium]
MAGERTEAPTPKRLKDARQKGNVARSDELVTIGVLFLAVAGLKMLGPRLWGDMERLLRNGLAHPASGEMTRESAFQLGKDSAWQMISAMLPLLGLLAIAAIVLNVAQTGLLLSGNGLKPNMNRLNPGSGLKRLVSVDGLMRLGKSLFKFTVVSVVVYITLKGQMSELSTLAQFSVGEGAGRMVSLGFDIAFKATAALLVMAVADYAWQRRRHIKQLMMTREELKQEMKENDGDPQVRAAIRRRRQQLMNRMMSAVKTADVVVTNPTHYAVALKYDPVQMQAPMVVAKGADHLARRIREVAMKNGVPVLEEPPLARALHAAAPVGSYIPANLFHAVAELLAWVYALRDKNAAARRRFASATPGGDA